MLPVYRPEAECASPYHRERLPRVNYLLPRNDDLVVCAYDLTKFGAGVMMDVLRTHPLVIIGGFLQENPFFVPPDELLRELRARDGSTPQS